MSDLTLIASATLLGLAGATHCAVMCSAACTAASGRSGLRVSLAFQAARLTAYAAAGALAAAAVGSMSTLAQFSPALRPLWTLLHAAALGLGLWLLWQGRQPAWMSAVGRLPPVAPATSTAPAAPAASAASTGWAPVNITRRLPLRAAAAGSLWVLLPCGLLQSALLVAALTQTAASGALAMAGFAVASAPGLLWAPWIWQRLGGVGGLGGRGRQGRQGKLAWDRALTRAAGVVLAAASAWALGHGLWQRVADFCFSP